MVENKFTKGIAAAACGLMLTSGLAFAVPFAMAQDADSVDAATEFEKNYDDAYWDYYGDKDETPKAEETKPEATSQPEDSNDAAVNFDKEYSDAYWETYGVGKIVSDFPPTTDPLPEYKGEVPEGKVPADFPTTDPLPEYKGEVPENKTEDAAVQTDKVETADVATQTEDKECVEKEKAEKVGKKKLPKTSDEMPIAPIAATGLAATLIAAGAARKVMA